MKTLRHYHLHPKFAATDFRLLWNRMSYLVLFLPLTCALFSDMFRSFFRNLILYRTEQKYKAFLCSNLNLSLLSIHHHLSDHLNGMHCFLIPVE